MIIAVTGATGFIGAALCAALTNAGYQVKALVRNPERAATLLPGAVELIDGDLNNAASLDRLATGSNCVVHCAGAVRGASQAEFDATNVAGTRHLIEALQRQQEAPRLLVLSSLAAREPQLSWYAASKYRGENLIANASPALEWVGLRPSPVYGPGDKEMLPVFKTMARGLTTVPGDPDNRISLIHVDDVVSNILCWLQASDWPRRSFELSDSRQGGYDWHELTRQCSQIWRRRIRLWRIPAWIADAVAGFNLIMAKLLGYAPMLTPAKLRELRHPNWVADNAAITAALDWQPQVSLEQGLKTLW